MQNIFVTGATSYLGKKIIAKLLEVDAKVFALIRLDSDRSLLSNNPNLHTVVYHGEYNPIAEIFAKINFDMVFHLAAAGEYSVTAEDIKNIIDANILLGAYVLDAMEKNGCKCFVNTGTYWQHYHSAQYNPVCLYAASKQSFEAIVDYYAFSNKISTITLKLFDVYGPDDHRRKILRIILEASQQGKVIDMSPGEQFLDFVYIDDVVNAFLSAASLLLQSSEIAHSRYFVGTGNARPLKEIVALLQKFIPFPLRVNWGGKSYHDREVMQPYSGVILPGWQAKVDIETGLAKMADTFLYNSKS